MKFTINSQNDVKALQGKFVLQIDNLNPEDKLTDYTWEFAKEKRLKFIVGYGFADLYGNYNNLQNYEDFKNYFNSYLYKKLIEDGKTDGGRHHRLLTNKELEYLIKKIKEENY